MALPIVLIFIHITWLYLCWFVSPFPINQIEGGESGIIQKEIDALGLMSRAEKIVAAVFCLTTLLWIFRRSIVIGDFILPGWSNIFENPKYLYDSTVAMAMAMGILLLLFPVNGSRGMDLNGKTEWFALDWKTVQVQVSLQQPFSF